MAYSASDLAALDAAIASSQLEVQFGDRKIRYRSMDELLKARQHVAQQIAQDAANAAGGRRATRRYVFSTMRGD